MSKSFINIVSEKIWTGHAENDKIRLFQMLIVYFVIVIGTLINLFGGFFLNSEPETSCLICNLSLVAVSIIALSCLYKGRLNCAVNLIFVIPLFVYANYISEFHSHPPFIETIYHSVWWLLAGGLLLLYFSNTEFNLLAYYLAAVFVIGLQLEKGNYLTNSFSEYSPIINHPVLFFSGIYIGAYILRKNFKKVAEHLHEKIIRTNQNLNKIIRQSEYLIAQITAERDEGGNVTLLEVNHINNAFEAAFKINLYEVQGQEANYIFNLIFRDSFDVNQTLFFTPSNVKEFYARNLDRWFKVQILKIELNRFFLIFEEITRAKKRIAQLEAGKKRYQVLLEAIPDIFFVIDKDGVYEDFVIKESDLFKVENSDIVGSTIFEVGFPENMAEKIYACIQSCLQQNSIETIEYSLKTPKGTFLFEMRLAKLNHRSVISVARDITKRKTAEFKLEKALEKAEESDRLKSAFLSNLSHEIRTPMNIITNFTRLLAEEKLQKNEKLELTDAISQNGKQLLNMIENTVHLSKIETGTVELSKSHCSVNELLREIYNRYLPLMPDSKKVRLNLKIDVPNKEFGFCTDRYLLKESVAILVDNAVKFTKSGEITFGYKMIRNERVQFEVSDTGIGIPEEEKIHIFSRFYRVKNEINETTSGSGVGLPVAQHYVALLGGELDFESTRDEGTRFWFDLPFTDGTGFLSIVS